MHKSQGPKEVISKLSIEMVRNGEFGAKIDINNNLQYIYE